MKIFIDDIRPAPEGWYLARTVTEAIRTIYYDGMNGTEHITHISLDFDISHPVTVGSLQRPFPCGENFAAVAYFIAEKYECHQKRPLNVPHITLHTSNLVGAENMQLILSRAGIPCTIKLSLPVTRPQPTK